MSAYLTWPVILCLVAGFGTLYLLYYLLTYRDKPGALWFAGAMVGQAVFLFAYGVGLTVFDPDLRLTFEIIALVALHWLGTPFLGFALEYTGRGEILRSWYYWVLYAFPVTATVLLPLNGRHELYWTDYTVESLFGAAVAAYDIGPLMYVTMLGGLAGTTVGVLLLVDAVLDYGSLFRSEALAVALSPVLPVIGLVIWLFDVTPYASLNWVAPLLVGHVAFDLYAFVGKGMFETHPATHRAAKQSALTGFRAPVLVVEEEGRVVELNPAAERELGLDRTDAILRQLPAVLDDLAVPDWEESDAIEAFLAGEHELSDQTEGWQGRDNTSQQQYREREGEWRLTVQNGTRQAEYTVQLSPLTAGGENVGYTLLFQDITEAIQREQRLSVLNRILRHNLRNDLSIVSGYVSAADSETQNELVEEMLEKVSTTVNELVKTGEMAREFEQLIAEPEEYARPIDLDAELDRIVERTAKEQPTARVSAAEVDITVETNPDILSSILWQLVENAIVHSETETPTVRLSAVETDTEVAIEIADDGPGIPDHELRAIEDGHETSLDHGSGFGLYFVKWGIARIGDVVDFETDDSGTTVRVTLPKDTPESQPQTSSASA